MAALQKATTISTVALFLPTREALLGLLRELKADDWHRPTVCAGWSVKDIAAHLWGGDVGVLSRHRDRYDSPDVVPPRSWPELVGLINSLNDAWVRSARRISPAVLCDLLELSGTQVESYFASLDPNAPGPPVDWAGEGPQPNWLDLAREYSERWHHQQQIRDAVGRPGLTEPRYLRPVLDTFVRALPHAFREVSAREGAEVQFSIRGDSGRDWILVREKSGWELYLGVAAAPVAEVAVDQDDAWRMFTKGLRGAAARARATIHGDAHLAEVALGATAIIA